MPILKKITTEILHTNPWWSYKHDHYLLADDQETDYYYAQIGPASLIIPVLGDGRLVLVRQYRYLHDKYNIEFPCGRSKADETSLDTAKRELLQETGFTAGNPMKIAEFEPAHAFCQHKINVFVDDEIKNQQEPTPQEGEIIEVIVRRIDEFEIMVKRGEINDGTSLAAWAIARDHVKNLIHS
ncbi:MAG: hypothetical protein COU31_01390 [Candidatus Magasanikbacteria bacterium CG10_big_fil_rev_8_21_14_0_10_40_10]|uniref:Nudix hydrolase domain-containing protein n=1 Tax=Candidatus Magasanikbacteria bacterium CG10_big_fil_rev_8_21_14_0_10_40_10 TaxID=1974648 RepID=A0A2M6W4K1_9BACT|nr:MAG: hypothetical protein COU31_01390 [Candidatus Magasanikbacteria bacterium CG10_big_fil_rev_8_21_14_0_10_40_10]